MHLFHYVGLYYIMFAMYYLSLYQIDCLQTSIEIHMLAKNDIVQDGLLSKKTFLDN